MNHLYIIDNQLSRIEKESGKEVGEGKRAGSTVLDCDHLIRRGVGVVRATKNNIFLMVTWSTSRRSGWLIRGCGKSRGRGIRRGGGSRVKEERGS